MYVASSVHARRLSMHCESCAPTACATRRCRTFTGRSSSPSYCMHPVLGPVSSRRPTDVFIDRSKRCGYCPPDLPPFDELLSQSDQQLFDKILINDQHLLYKLLPPPSVASQNYYIRDRPHNKELPYHTGHLTDSNFITRMLFTDIY